MARILGLDISSSSTGWAVLDDGLLPSDAHRGLIKMKQKTHGERLLYFETELTAILDKFNVDLVAVEDIWSGKFIQPALILARYRGIVEKICWTRFKSEPMVRTASEFRKTIGTKYKTNLLPGKKEKEASGKDSKTLTFELISTLFNLDSFTFSAHNDITDAIAVGLGASLIVSGEVQTESGAALRPVKPKKLKSKKQKRR